jgi:hypothetical protein
MAGHALAENVFAGSPDSLFHLPEYFRFHAGGSGVYLEWTKGARVDAAIHFTQAQQGAWRSPARGTYCGYLFDPALREEDLWAFHGQAENALRMRGASSIEILPPPMCHHAAAFARQFYLLRASGYEAFRLDLNYGLAVTSLPFVQGLSDGNRKRLPDPRRKSRFPRARAVDVAGGTAGHGCAVSGAHRVVRRSGRTSAGCSGADAAPVKLGPLRVLLGAPAGL